MRDLRYLDFWPAEQARLESLLFTEDMVEEMAAYSLRFTDDKPNFDEFCLEYFKYQDTINVLKPKFWFIVNDPENRLLPIVIKDVVIEKALEKI